MNTSQKSEEVNRLARIKLSDLYQELDSSISGINPQSVKARLKKFGPNQVGSADDSSPVIKLVKMFLSPLPLLLICLAIVSYLTNEKTGSIVIVVMVFLSILLTFIQEHKSNKAAEKLKALVATKASVVRGGFTSEITISEIVPGDIVHLAAGDIVPGDIRLIESKNLFINESSLTGESLPVEKNEQIERGVANSIFAWSNLCFMGSHVVSGTAKGLVLRTGRNTFFGELAHETTQHLRPSAFDQGIKKYIWLMLRVIFVMVPVVFLMNGLIKGDWIEAALFAVAISVGLAPEMLPLLVTINLAKGALMMSKKRVIVKRLNAIQNLGGMNILCADKTGTLTQDQIILEKHVDVDGHSDQRVLDYAYLNSHYQSGLKNLLDVAVLKHVEIHEHLHSVDSYTKVDEIPFDFQRRRMSVVVEKNNNSRLLICKGAVEEIFACCRYAQRGNELIPLDESHLSRLQNVVAELNNDGYRVIAVAMKEEQITRKSYSLEDESNLTLLGYIVFLDPPKESAKQAIKELIASGIQVKILTGDNALITRKVCRDVELQVEAVILGSEVEQLSEEQLKDVANKTTVFAKMTPHQKARVIQALQSQGNVVGYLGDGINDGPSLKLADVSISVDTAADIAKESADIILLEKSLLVLQQGVLEGRRVFGNLMKYLKIASSSNLGNVISMLLASALLPFLPMAPVQILMNDLLYDLSQSAVPTDYVDDEYLKSPKTWDMRGVTHYMFFIGPISSLFDCLLFIYMWFVLKANSIDSESLFQTGWFIESLLSQTLIVHILRTGKIPFLESTASPALLFTTIAISLLGILLPYTALGEFLKMQALPSEYWLGLAVLLICYLLLTQYVKTVLIKRYGLV